MNLAFERAKPADVETLVAVQIAAFHNDAVIYPGVPVGGPPGYNSIDVNLALMREDDYYKMLADGRIVGGIIVHEVGHGHFHLGVLYVDPAYHRRGIGSAALAFIERAYPSAALWTLNTPAYATHNHRFYEKHGFVKVGQRPFSTFGLFDYQKISPPHKTFAR